MKTKLEMAHEWAMKIIEGNVRVADASDLLERAWQYADAMQAEADKRESKSQESSLVSGEKTNTDDCETQTPCKQCRVAMWKRGRRCRDHDIISNEDK